MNYETFVFFNNHFLVAMPGLVDPNFAKGIICVCEHTKNGAFGLGINRIHPTLTIKDLFVELDIKFNICLQDMPIYIGGPVRINEVFILHGPPFHWNGCKKINSSLGFSNTTDIIKAIAENRGPQLYMIILGSAGWGPGHIENEIKANYWISFQVNNNIIFSKDINKKWDDVFKINNIDPILLSGEVGRD